MPGVLTFSQSQADVDTRNNRKQTPLMLAVSQDHWSLVKLLVQSHADVNVHDDDGDTCLHLALLRQTVTSGKDSGTLPEPVSPRNATSWFLFCLTHCPLRNAQLDGKMGRLVNVSIPYVVLSHTSLV